MDWRGRRGRMREKLARIEFWMAVSIAFCDIMWGDLFGDEPEILCSCQLSEDGLSHSSAKRIKTPR